MKKFTQWLLLPLIAVSFQAKAQDYNISFAILGSTDNPTTVAVENTTQGTEKTLNGSDVLNLVADLTGINDLSTDAAALKVYPNPVGQSATLTFTNPQAGNVTISLVNTAGVQLANINSQQPQGELSYTLSGFSVGNYIVNVQSGSYKASCVVMSQLEQGGVPQIVFNNAQETSQAPMLKSAKAATTVKMQYTTGDVLKFTANVNLKDAIVDNYTATKNDEIEFTFSFTVTFADHDGTELKSESVNYGSSATAPSVSDSTGYTFAWDKAFDNITEDITVKATYTPINYAITYHNVGTKNAAATPTVYTVATSDITLAVPNDSTGYTFAGWYTNAAFNDTISTPAIAQGSTGDKAFYAKWLDNTTADGDGNMYVTVTIGTQVWMAENLRATTYADGTAISNVTDNTAWGNLGDNDTDKAYCWYDNDSISYSQTYGALYTYAAASNGNNSYTDVQGVCPTGWHLPSDAEWTTLIGYLTANGHSATKGTALKSTSGWRDDGNGTDDYGFAALPGGKRGHYGGAFFDAGYYGNWWISAPISSSANYRYLYYDNANVYSSYDAKSNGFSVRCVRD